MSFNVNVKNIDLRDCELTIGLGGNRGEIDVRATYQGDRWSRVSGIWRPHRHPPVVLTGGYLDSARGELITAEEAVKRVPRRMWAHTIHGADRRRLLDEGKVSW